MKVINDKLYTKFQKTLRRHTYWMSGDMISLNVAQEVYTNIWQSPQTIIYDSITLNIITFDLKIQH